MFVIQTLYPVQLAGVGGSLQAWMSCTAGTAACRGKSRPGSPWTSQPSSWHQTKHPHTPRWNHSSHLQVWIKEVLVKLRVSASWFKLHNDYGEGNYEARQESKKNLELTDFSLFCILIDSMCVFCVLQPLKRLRSVSMPGENPQTCVAPFESSNNYLRPPLERRPSFRQSIKRLNIHAQ